ncbi:MAG: GreA/GreB family elongation factor [Armatimonadetes bacterium]|nr:GreA/GreB family elongation factor [Armatimonadota bacterium]
MTFDVLKRVEESLGRDWLEEEAACGQLDGIAHLLHDAGSDELDLVYDWLMAQLETKEAPETDQPARGIMIRYALAKIHELKGDQNTSGRYYLESARGLAELGFWSEVRKIAMKGLSLRPDHRFVRLLFKAWRAGTSGADPGGLQRDVTTALDYLPEDPYLLWHESTRADAEGRSEEGARLASRALRGFIQLKEIDRAEEALLRTLEFELPEACLAVLEALPLMAEQNSLELLRAAVEFAQPVVESLGLHRQFADNLEKALTRPGEVGFLRSLFVDATLKEFADRENLSALVRRSGISDPNQPFGEALVRLREFLRLSPGTIVEHRSWGMGRVTANDGESLLVDFPGKPDHRMSVEMGQTSLSPLPPYQLRVLAVTNPDLLQHERSHDPVGLVVRVVQELGGEAQPKDLKLKLVESVFAESEWASWWQKTRKLLEEDPRIDHNLAFKQIYRLPQEGSARVVVLPAIDQKKGLRSSVSAIRRFLKQHVDMVDAMRQKYGDSLISRAEGTLGDELLGVSPLLAEWFPDERARWVALVYKAFSTGARTASVTTAEDQGAVLSLALDGSSWERAAVTTLTSRFAVVRNKALETLCQRWTSESRTSEERDQKVRDALRRHSQFPCDCLALSRFVCDGERFKKLEEPWSLLPSLLAFGLGRPTSEVVDLCVGLLDPKGPFFSSVQGRGCPKAVCDELLSMLSPGSLPETVSQGLVGFVQSAGENQLAEQVASAVREDYPPQHHESAPYLKPGVVLMTRSAQAAQQEELKTLERELRVDLPQAIRKARELGDLSENAEYHAARERQGIVNSQFLVLRERLAHVQCIEDLELPEDVVGVGTEVLLREEDGATSVVWILGVGDDRHGTKVISYEAPLGLALLGKRSGDVVELLHGSDSKTFHVVSMTRKLPDGDIPPH